MLFICNHSCRPNSITPPYYWTYAGNVIRSFRILTTGLNLKIIVANATSLDTRYEFKFPSFNSDRIEDSSCVPFMGRNGSLPWILGGVKLSTNRVLPNKAKQWNYTGIDLYVPRIRHGMVFEVVNASNP